MTKNLLLAYLWIIKKLLLHGYKILIKRLAQYGIRGVTNNKFISYLIKRSQYVSILGYDFRFKELKYGVPRGSVLDLHKPISLFFADEKVYYESVTIQY